MGDLKVLTHPTSQDHATLAAWLREHADAIEKHGAPITGVAIAVAFGDGSTATEYAGTDFVHLLGAVTILQRRLGNEFQRA